MSHWLKSVGNILEKLDDRVETVAEDAPTSSAALSRLLGNNNAQNESEDGSYYDDEADVENEDLEKEGGMKQDSNIKSGEENAIGEDGGEVDTPHQENIPDSTQTDDVVKEAEGQYIVEGGSGSVSNIDTSKRSSEGSSSAGREDCPSEKEDPNSFSRQDSSGSKLPPPSPDDRATKASGRATSRAGLQKAQQEAQRLTKQNTNLQAKLTAAQNELAAQNEELLRAADRMEKDRQKAKEERKQLVNKHEEALRNLKTSYEASLAHQKETSENQHEALRKQLVAESQMRAKEGGDMAEELGGAFDRERKALEKVDQLELDNSQLEQMNKNLVLQEQALREEVLRLEETAQASAERERLVEEKLDAANEKHLRSLNHRQAREAELERTVAELGAALALKASESNRPVIDSAMARAVEAGSDIHKRYNVLMEELDNVKGQLAQANQRSKALQTELQSISRERTEEASMEHEKQREHDIKVQQLTSRIAHLEGAGREHAAGQNDGGTHGEMWQLTRDLEQSRRQIKTLSDQLLRQQGFAESAKSEALTLRTRLKSATSRAEAVETGGNNDIMNEMDGGIVGYGTNLRQRKVKRRGAKKGRALRSVFGLDTAESGALHHIALTVDAMDSWMLQTGVILHHEPLARIGCLLYLCLVHVSCFGLVFFHSVVRGFVRLRLRISSALL